MPKPVSGLDVRKLPIGPEEAFVLSRIDGAASRSEIALMTGLDAQRVSVALDRLAALGAVSMPGAPKPEAASGIGFRAEPERRAVSGLRPAVTPEAMAAPVRIMASTVAFDPAELDEPADIPLDRKHQILEAFHSLERLDHYQLLGVKKAAEKQEIKSAYYARVTTFHPDRYFGKSLGNFKQKLEKVFERLTLAHDTLTRKKSRAEYDAYLESQRATRALSGELDYEAEIEAIQQQVREEALLRPGASPTPVPSELRDVGTAEAPRQHRASVPPMSPEERRRALARKLSSGSDRPSRPSMPAVTITTPVPGAHEAAADELKRRYEDRVVRAMRERVARYVQQADQAEATKNFVAAVNALRIARSLAPDDSALAQRFERIQNLADAALSARYLEQAEYEERTGSHLTAARHYERAAKGQANPARLLDRAAHCYLQAGQELRHASDLAKKAVELSPTQVAYRITLARIYAEANMAQSALAELERARTLEPGNDSIKDWIKRLKRNAG